MAGISAATGINHSGLVEMLKRRTYLGEIPDKGEWLPGLHEPTITLELFDVANRGRISGRKRDKDLLSGRVRCGICERAMSIESNGQGQKHYRCRHRGGGCVISARSNRGLLDAVVLGLELLRNEELQDAIRRYLADRRQPVGGRRRRTPGSAGAFEALQAEQAKLLQAHYKGLVDDELLGREQARLREKIENLTHEVQAIAAEALEQTDLAARFEDVLRVLEELNLAELWPHATEAEKRTLLNELLKQITIHPDRLTVHFHGAPPLNGAFSDVGLKDSELTRVGGGT